ncbi:MAG: glutathione S-transferase family protein, partial [Caulobacterales bacterium]|nr:glutathione S-transferase family protein [Caulobacterales bacterium]
ADRRHDQAELHAMGVITPTNTEVLGLQGLHLYHAGVSNCSMRVRMTLAEKQLPWESHHLDIVRKEHITREYFGINPNGLVPTLVHDGVVIIESDDIIDYLDTEFPTPALRPADEAGLERMYHWLRLAPRIHVSAVKTFIYHKKMRGKMSQSEEVRRRYRELQRNKELLEFHEKSSTDGFTEADILAAEDTLAACFSEMNGALADGAWIAGNEFTLADIAWVPLHFTLDRLARFSFASYPRVQAWAERLAARASYRTAILDWWPAPAEA